MIEKLPVVAKEIFENLPLKDLTFNPKSVDEIVEILKTKIAEESISKEWVNGVYDASVKGYPVVIEFDGTYWSFHSMPNPAMTRDDLIVQLAHVHEQIEKGNVTYQDKDGKEIKMNRAERRARKFNH